MASVARNTAYLTIAKTLNVAIYAIFGLLLGKFVTVETNGLYGLMSALLFFGSMAASFGIPLVLVRAVAQERGRAGEVFVEARTAMLLGSIVAGVAIVGYLAVEMHLQGRVEGVRYLLALLVTGILVADSWAAAGEGIFQGFEEMTFPAKVDIVTGALRVAGGLAALFLLRDAGAWTLVAIYSVFFVGSGLRALWLTPAAQRRFLPADLPPARIGEAVAMFKRSLGVALFRMLRMVRNRVDTLLIGLLIPVTFLSLQETADLARGIYTQAFRVVLVFHTLTLAFNTAIFPGMVRAAGADGDLVGARQRFFRAVAYQAWWAAPLAAVTFLYSDDIAGWFQPEYRDGVPGVNGTMGEVLRILVIAVLLDSVGGPVGMVVLGNPRMDKFLPLLGGALAGLSVVLNLLWIPRFGILGAAYASLAASALEVVLKLFLVSRLLGRPWIMLPRTLPYVALAAAMAWTLSQSPLASHPIGGSVSGAAVYLAATLALGLVDPAIRRRLVRALRRGAG